MSQKLILMKWDREYLKWNKKMDLHEEDKEHMTKAHASAMEIVNKYDDWIKIDCERDWKMRGIDEINDEIMKNIID